MANQQKLNLETEAEIALQLDQLIAAHAHLFIPYPEGPVTKDRIGPITSALAARVDEFSELGHNVIFSAYALRALRDDPSFDSAEAITDIATTISAFGSGRARYWLHLDISKGHDPRIFKLSKRAILPDEISEYELAQVIFTELTQFRHIYTQMGSKSHIGHLLTQAHAILTLRNLGQRTLANRGLYSLECRLILLRDSQNYRAGPHSFYTQATRSNSLPSEIAFWKQDFTRCSWDEGHTFKYTLSFYELADLVSDSMLRSTATEKFRYLISPNERSKPR